MMVMPFLPDHLRIMEPRARECELFGVTGGPEGFAARAMEGTAYTALIEDGTVVGALGVMPFLPRGRFSGEVGHAWGVFSPLLPQYRKSIYASVKKFLTYVMDFNEYRRIQATTQHGHPEAERFVQHLGFVLETPAGMRGYGHEGETYYLWALTK